MNKDLLNMVGKKAKIGNYEYTSETFNGKRRNCVRIYTEAIGTYKGTRIRASVLFRLINADRTWLPNGKLAHLLRKLNVVTIEEAIGKEVMIIQDNNGWYTWKLI